MGDFGWKITLTDSSGMKSITGIPFGTLKTIQLRHVFVRNRAIGPLVVLGFVSTDARRSDQAVMCD